MVLVSKTRARGVQEVAFAFCINEHCNLSAAVTGATFCNSLFPKFNLHFSVAFAGLPGQDAAAPPAPQPPPAALQLKHLGSLRRLILGKRQYLTFEGCESSIPIVISYIVIRV